ncbi:Os09g0379750 [Oryza sativa Japonica Group]|uniref:cysteine dioxygenase n=1 Tax=Oryza sativa subsp. japonica TaxID=39947 RepID=A0A0P0XLL1_ORYSJ|nr:Os09g0379750 [Oryza sativa Japonica Group]
MPPLLGIHVFTDRLAFVAADWCFRLHGRPIICCRCWASVDWCPHLYGWLVTPPYMGVYVFTDRLAFAAADWCFRLHGWPIMPPLLGVYDFIAGLPLPPLTGVFAYTEWISQNITTGSPSSPPTGVFAYTVGWSQHRCQASTFSPPVCFRRRRLVSPPTRLAYYAAVVGRLPLHRLAASSAAD